MGSTRGMPDDDDSSYQSGASPETQPLNTSASDKEKELTYDEETGLPVIDKEDAKKGQDTAKLIVAGLVVVVPLVGLILAWALSWIDKSLYDQRIKSAHDQDQQWLYAAAFIFCRLTAFLNAYPMIAKAGVMASKADNLRANMYILKVLDPLSKKVSPVVLEDKGVVGEYNRANRSLHHFTENMAIMVLSLYLVGVIFPAMAFVCTLVYAAGRVWHQMGYSSGGYGSHGGGFTLTMLAGMVMEGFLLLVCVG